MKIDDVNGDGTPEIWCGDAIGHLYLFRKSSSGNWSCYYRSTDLGCYPGADNNIYPIKNAQHQTTKVIVASAGYVMAFNVDPSHAGL